MKRWLRNKIKQWFGLYDIKDLQVGGNCGICGEYMPDAILEKQWPWGLCRKCSGKK